MDKAVDTENLTRSFGWTSYDAFQQHDVQELSRKLLDNIEEKMKETRSDGVIGRLLKGEIRNYIECVNVNFTSERLEAFYDIQLDVKGCRNVKASFEKYIEAEMLDGENQYDAGEKFGKQDAKKGVKFVTLPPVLHLQLKRFEYDYVKDCTLKINDRYKFGLKLKLDPYVANKEDKEGSEKTTKA